MSNEKRQELLQKTSAAMTTACMAALLRNNLGNAESRSIEDKIVLDAYAKACTELVDAVVALARAVAEMPDDDTSGLGFDELMKSFNEEGTEAEGET